jgi:hypothetical protein
MASVVGDIGDRDNGDRIRPEPRISHAKKESVKAAKILIKTVNHANLMMENLFACHVFSDISYNTLSI